LFERLIFEDSNVNFDVGMRFHVLRGKALIERFAWISGVDMPPVDNRIATAARRVARTTG
jgi:hypothetical protein